MEIDSYTMGMMSMKNRNFENKKLSNYNIVKMNKSELNKLKKKELVDLLLKDQRKSKNLFQHHSKL